LEKVLRKEGCNEKTTMTSSKFLAKHEDWAWRKLDPLSLHTLAASLSCHSSPLFSIMCSRYVSFSLIFHGICPEVEIPKRHSTSDWLSLLTISKNMCLENSNSRKPLWFVCSWLYISVTLSLEADSSVFCPTFPRYCFCLALQFTLQHPFLKVFMEDYFP
jgi:hypothetical protein